MGRIAELSLVLLSSILNDVECFDFETGFVVFFLLTFEFLTNDEGCPLTFLLPLVFRMKSRNACPTYQIAIKVEASRVSETFGKVGTNRDQTGGKNMHEARYL